jgi:hypothetical protein
MVYDLSNQGNGPLTASGTALARIEFPALSLLRGRPANARFCLLHCEGTAAARLLDPSLTAIGRRVVLRVAMPRTLGRALTTRLKTKGTPKAQHLVRQSGCRHSPRRGRGKAAGILRLSPCGRAPRSI